jgi:hypothetical protein
VRPGVQSPVLSKKKRKKKKKSKCRENPKDREKIYKSCIHGQETHEKLLNILGH